MAFWERSEDSDLGYEEAQWTQLRSGVRWFYQHESDPPQFALVVEEEGPAPPDAAGMQRVWHDADWWRDDAHWPGGQTAWIDDLTRIPTPAVHAHPTVVPGTVEYARRGAYCWPVSFSIGVAQPVTSWIIQKVTIVDPKHDSTFWEAFEVEAGTTAAAFEDIFQAGELADEGVTTVTALVQHHSFAGSEPPGMKKRGAELADSGGLSTEDEPSFWVAGAGTRHEFKMTWTNEAVDIVTEPDAGAPVAKDDVSDLSFG